MLTRRYWLEFALLLVLTFLVASHALGWPVTLHKATLHGVFLGLVAIARLGVQLPERWISDRLKPVPTFGGSSDMSLLSSLLNSLGESAVESLLVSSLESTVMGAATAAGVAGFERIITIPQSTLQAICAKTGADPTEAEAKMKAAVAAYGDLIVCLANVTPSGATP